MAASVERARLLDNYHPYRDDLDRQLTESLCDRFTAITSVIYSLFVSIFQDRHRYDALLSYRGDSAQQILDLLQMVHSIFSSCLLYVFSLKYAQLLDYPAAGSAAKKSLLVTLARLSSKSGLHPRCFILTGILRGKSPLASGSFGDIWKGDFNGQPVCLKIIKMYESSNKDKWLKVLRCVFCLRVSHFQKLLSWYLMFSQAFSKEAVLWSQISHPNVLPFYGIFHLDEVHGRICLVSPWMDRGNINEYLSQNPDVPRLLLVAFLSYLCQFSLTKFRFLDIRHRPWLVVSSWTRHNPRRHQRRQFDTFNFGWWSCLICAVLGKYPRDRIRSCLSSRLRAFQDSRRCRALWVVIRKLELSGRNHSLAGPRTSWPRGGLSKANYGKWRLRLRLCSLWGMLTLPLHEDCLSLQIDKKV